jgi:hypothetical protein
MQMVVPAQKNEYGSSYFVFMIENLNVFSTCCLHVWSTIIPLYVDPVDEQLQNCYYTLQRNLACTKTI